MHSDKANISTFIELCALLKIIVLRFFFLHRIVKLTSPNLNYFIHLGALSLYVGSLIRVTPSTSLAVWDHVCRVSNTHATTYYMVLMNFWGILLSKYRPLLPLYALDTRFVLGPFWRKCGGYTTYSITQPQRKRYAYATRVLIRLV